LRHVDALTAPTDGLKVPLAQARGALRPAGQ